MLKTFVFHILCLQSAVVENDCDRNCSNETRTCMDNLRKCTLKKKRNIIYRNMADSQFDFMVSDSINTTLPSQPSSNVTIMLHNILIWHG